MIHTPLNSLNFKDLELLIEGTTLAYKIKDLAISAQRKVCGNDAVSDGSLEYFLNEKAEKNAAFLMTWPSEVQAQQCATLIHTSIVVWGVLNVFPENVQYSTIFV